MKRKIVGIAGFIGSGKTEAGLFFQKKGALFIDADDVVTDLYQPGEEGYRKIVNYFGDAFLKKNKEVDRRKLAQFVFGDLNKLKIINNLIHPLVTNEVQKRIDISKERIVVIEATYFAPKHLGRIVDAILWIECNEEVLKERVLQRSGMDESLLESVYKSQSKPESVDFVVSNNDSMSSFHDGLKKMWEKW